MMKRYGNLVGGIALATATLFSVSACEKAEEGNTTKAKAEGAAAEVSGKIAEAAGMLEKGGPISAAEYEKLILAHASCKVTDNGIDSKCDAVKNLRARTKRGQLAKGVLGGNAGLGRKLIGHEAPAVRIKAANMMGSMLGTASKSQDVIVEAAAKEKHPGVLKAMIRTVRNDGAKNEKVGKMLLGFADHDNAMIRKEAVYALSSSWNKELEGGPEKLISMMKDDKDMEVRKAACEYAGGLGDEKLWGDCFEGLVSMWADYPLYGTSNQDAYKLTLKLMNDKPRTENIPPWTAMSEFGHLGSTTNKKVGEWKSKATWYKEDDVKKALSAIVADGDANWMARTGATKSLAKLGTSKADLEKLRKGLGDKPTGKDSHVAKELDKAIAAAK